MAATMSDFSSCVLFDDRTSILTQVTEIMKARIPNQYSCLSKTWSFQILIKWIQGLMKLLKERMGYETGIRSYIATCLGTFVVECRN